MVPVHMALVPSHMVLAVLSCCPAMGVGPAGLHLLFHMHTLLCLSLETMACMNMQLLTVTHVLTKHFLFSCIVMDGTSTDEQDI